MPPMPSIKVSINALIFSATRSMIGFRSRILGLKLRELIISCSRGRRLAEAWVLMSFDGSSGLIFSAVHSSVKASAFLVNQGD
jgi:hypothetical protein